MNGLTKIPPIAATLSPALSRVFDAARMGSYANPRNRPATFAVASAPSNASIPSGPQTASEADIGNGNVCTSLARTALLSTRVLQTRSLGSGRTMRDGVFVPSPARRFYRLSSDAGEDALEG